MLFNFDMTPLGAAMGQIAGVLLPVVGIVFGLLLVVWVVRLVRENTGL